jgi:transcriptional regulator with XRE-family HTH domain
MTTSPDRQRRKAKIQKQLDATARRMRLARERLGISEKEAAAAAGVCVRTYRKYEAGGPSVYRMSAYPMLRLAGKFPELDVFRARSTGARRNA